MRAQSLNRLSARAVTTIKEPGLHADGGGLYLSVTDSGSKSWRFIYRLNKKRREKGLGALASVSLADARAQAEDLRKLIVDGQDPLEVRDADAGETPAFGPFAESVVKTLEVGWKNAKHRQQWKNTLKTYCAPIWGKPVDRVTTEDVKAILLPIWQTVPDTASRLRGRIERVLDAAKVGKHIRGPWENPARWRGHLEIIMPKKKNGQKRHHPAMPCDQVADFVRGLKTRVSMAARALEFLIHTVGRTNEVLGAMWKEFDLEKRLWTIPAERMKMPRDHVVPLTDPAMVVLSAMAVFGTDPDAPVFPSRKGKPLSNMSMEMLLRRMGCDDYTVHGFRSSFRDWVGDETEFDEVLAELALAHEVGSKVEQAYRRGTALAKRRELMEAWSGYVMLETAS